MIKKSSSSKELKQLYLCAEFEDIYHLERYEEYGLNFTDLMYPKRDYLLKNLIDAGWKIISQSQIKCPSKDKINIFLLLERYE